MRCVLINIGCAECRGTWDEPLVNELLFFDNIDAAQAHVGGNRRWHTHPVDGVFCGEGDGDYWIVPVTAFTGPS